MHYTIYMRSFYAIFCVLCLTAFQGTAATIEVTTTDDTGTGSLRQTIGSASSGDTILFSSLIEGDTIFLTRSVSISKNLTIMGDSNSSTILDGSGSTLILNIPSGKIVKLSRLKLINGNSSQGGAIYNTGTLIMNSCSLLQNVAGKGGAIYNNWYSTLIMKNCEILGNRGTGSRGGGAIFGAWADLTFINCSLSGNKCDGYGGALYNEFGGENTFINSTLSGNSAFRGGAIYSEHSTSLRNCIVAKNSAISSNNFAGGPIFQGSYNFIDDTTDVANVFDQTNLKGGSGVNALDPLFVTNVDMSSLPNTSGDLRLLCNSLALNAGTPDTTGLNIGITDIRRKSRVIGSTIDIGAYERQITETLIVTNCSNENSGSLRFFIEGACTGDTILFDSSINGDTIFLTTQIELNKNLTIIGNDTSNTIIDGMDNSRIFEIPQGDTIYFTGLTLQNGNTSENGGGIRNSGTAHIYSSHINNNVAQGMGESDGGGIYNNGNLYITGTTFTNNSCDGNGGSIQNHSINDHITTIVNRSEFIGNTAKYGGAVSNNSDGTEAVIQFKNCLISGNISTQDGGGIANRSTGSGIAATVITNSTISGNKSGKSGGGIANIKIEGNTLLEVQNSIVALNIDDGSGPDIYNDNADIEDKTHNLIGDTTSVANLFGSTNLKGGSGIHSLDPLFITNVDTTSLPNSSGDLRLQCNSIALNSGASDTTGLNIGITDIRRKSRVIGSTIDIGAYERQITEILIVTNCSNENSGSLRFIIERACSGDTILFDSSINGDTIFLTTQIELNKNLTIIGNDTSNTIIDGMDNSRIFEIPQGDTIYITGVTLQNGNASGGGGAILIQGALHLNHSSLCSNSASSEGGALLMGPAFGISATIRNVSFTENYANSDGGAISNYEQLEISNSKISGNSSRSGGGIINYGSMNITNGILSGNKASDKGGGIYSSSIRTNLSNVTITGNTAIIGGGIYVEQFQTSLRNTIVAVNSAHSFKDAYVNGSEFEDRGFNIIGDTTSIGSFFTSSTSLGSSLNPIDPLFIMDVPNAPSILGDLRLQCGSPAIDTGTPDTSGQNIGIIDIANLPRIITNTIDIGAHEFQVSEASDPLIVNSTSDIGCGSLRFAVFNANQGDTVLFHPSIDGDTITVYSAINFGKNLNLIGNDTTKTIVSGQDSTVVFSNSIGDTVNIESLNITKGKSIVGGGVFNNGSLNISHCSINGNKATNRGGGLANFGELQLLNSSISKNKIIAEGGTQAQGGGIYSVATLSVLGSVINQNYAEADEVLGGGVYSKSTIKFMNSILSSNHAAGSSFAAGGAIYMESFVDTTDIVNCLVSGNLVESSYSIGGGLFSLSPTSITNSTISGNQCGSLGTGQGGGIWISGNTNIANTIVAKNNAVSDGIDIYRSGGTINDIGNNHVMAAGGNHGITSGNGIDPLFIKDVDLSIMPTLSGDLRLWCNSPAIDAGTLDTSGLNIGNIDLNGFARTVNNRIDIGAIEFFDDQLIDQLILNGTPPIEKLETAKNIDAGATVDNSTTLFRVEETVTLSENFEVGLGKDFEVVLDTCPN